MNTATHSGGCQCGAVRFRVEGQPLDCAICHCRMCQKAFGAYYAPLVAIGEAKLTWTRGRPRYFHSSNHVRRGFCENCGTPLSYEADDGVAISAGSFDDPAFLPPVVQFGIEGKLPFMDGLHALPGRHTMEDIGSAPFLDDIVSNQHPDHDTTAWSPLPSRSEDKR